MKPANLAPVYCSIYAELAELTREHGYALAIHGSMSRDFDLICVPWVANPSHPQTVIDKICDTYACNSSSSPTKKEHGRIAYSVCFGFGDFFADISFTPTNISPPVPEINTSSELTALLNAVESFKVVKASDKWNESGKWDNAYDKLSEAAIKAAPLIKRLNGLGE